METAVLVEHFDKSFAQHQVITDLSFEVYSGELFALLGPNGSGKTTTIRCLLGIYEPSGGNLLINGAPYSPGRAHELGYLPEERGLYMSSRVLETMVYFGQLKGMAKGEARQAATAYLSRVGLLDKANEVVQKLSSGQQQKIQMGITVINAPKLLILDEPTKGLDPVNRALLLEILRELNQKGTTILFSTHQMEEVEKIADRMLMINNGKRALYGEVDAVRRQFGSNTLKIRYHGTFVKNDALFTAHLENHEAELVLAPQADPQMVLAFLVKAGVLMESFELTAPSLQDIFVQVVSGDNHA